MNLFKYLLVASCGLFVGCGGQKYAGSQEQKAMSFAMHAHGEKTARELGIRFLLVGNVTDNQDVQYCISFASNTHMSIDQARPMGVSIIKDFLFMLEHNSAVQQYLNSKPTYAKDEESPTLDSIGFRISFCDKNMKQIQQPYLAQILFFDGQFHYYKADSKTQGLRLVYEESYDAALRNIRGRG